MKPKHPYTGKAPFQLHSDTSEAAADSIEPKSDTLRGKVLGFVMGRRNHGATDEEIQAALSMPANTERPRRRELEIKGQVKDGGNRRKTRSGRRAVVWVASDLPGYIQGPSRTLRAQLAEARGWIKKLEKANETLRGELARLIPGAFSRGLK